MWMRSDIPKNEKIKFLINVLQNDKHLNVIAAASSKINEERKVKEHPLGTDEILKWWEENKEKYN